MRALDEIEDSGAELGAIYHSHTRSEPYPSQTDINFAANWPGVEWLIVGVRKAAASRPCGPIGSTTAWSTEVEVDDRCRAPLTCPSCATPHPADARFCPECGMPLVLRRRRGEPCPAARRGRARSSRSSPRASSCASPAPATRPRPSSSRGSCWRRASRRCCAARAASTCPTCSPPARATSSSPRRAPRPPATCCCAPTSSVRRAPRARREPGAAARRPLRVRRACGDRRLAGHRAHRLAAPLLRRRPGAPGARARCPRCARASGRGRR